MSDVQTKSVNDVLESIRRFHNTGEIDAIVVVAIGKDPTNMSFIGVDVNRPGDLVRMIGAVAILQKNLIAGSELEPLKEPGPKGIA